MSDFYNMIEWSFHNYGAIIIIVGVILVLVTIVSSISNFIEKNFLIKIKNIHSRKNVKMYSTKHDVVVKPSSRNPSIDISVIYRKINIHRRRITLPKILVRKRVNANVTNSEKLSEASGVFKPAEGVPQHSPSQGILRYTHPTTMVVDIPERMSAAIMAADLTPQATSFLSSQMAGNTDKIKTEPIKVQQVMTLTLVADSRHFSISSVSAHQQLLTGDYGSAVWHWDVLPLMRGNHKLEIVVNCCHQLANGSIVESAEIPPRTFVIRVKTNMRRTAAIWLASIAGALLLTFTSALVTHYFPSIVRLFDTYADSTPEANDHNQSGPSKAPPENGVEPSTTMPQPEDIAPAAKKSDTENATEQPMVSE